MIGRGRGKVNEEEKKEEISDISRRLLWALLWAILSLKHPLSFFMSGFVCAQMPARISPE